MPIVNVTNKPPHFTSMQWDGDNYTELSAWLGEVGNNILLSNNGDGTLSYDGMGTPQPVTIQTGDWFVDRWKWIPAAKFDEDFQVMNSGGPHTYTITED